MHVACEGYNRHCATPLGPTQSFVKPQTSSKPKTSIQFQFISNRTNFHQVTDAISGDFAFMTSRATGIINLTEVHDDCTLYFVLADPSQELWRQMLDKEGADGLLGEMVGRIQGCIRSSKSKQQVRSSSSKHHILIEIPNQLMIVIMIITKTIIIAIITITISTCCFVLL